MKNKEIKINFTSIWRITGILLIVILVSSIMWAAFYSRFRVRVTPQMFLYSFTHEYKSLNYKVEYQWVPLDSISRNLVVAVLAAEDMDFYIHDGFAPIYEEDSTKSLLPGKHETITQKAVHSTFLTNGDSWLKNILEQYYTILAEYLWGKERILEVYLNTALMGNGIFGVEAASRIYFNKPAGDVTLHEAAFIASLIEEAGTVDIENPDEKILEKQNQVLLDMALMMHIKIGKNPVDEKEYLPAKPIYRRKWRG